MGFFDDLGSIISDVTSMGDELKNTASEAIQNIAESKDELVTLKDEVVDDVTQVGEELKETLEQKI